MSGKDYYEILGVSKDASTEEIKKAYKTLAKKYHPDLAGEGADEEKFKEISNAYSTLSNSEKRKQYDTFGQAGASGQGFGQGFSGFSRGGFSSQGFDFSDIFSSFMGGEDDIFSGFSRRDSRRNQRQENLDIVEQVDLTFEEAYKGVKKKIEIYKDVECTFCAGTGSKSMKKETCDVCHGRGRTVTTKRTPFGAFSVENICHKCNGKGTIIKDPCSKCNGKGYVRESKKINVDIPSGVNNRDVIRVVSQGHEHNNQKGNLFLNINVKPHEFFKRDEYDLYCEVPISYTDLVFGTTLKLNLFGDKIKVKIPSSTTNNTILRVKNKGFNHVNSRGSGDLFIKVISEIPSKVSGDFKKKLKELKDLEDKNITKEINKKYKNYIEL